jgi:hypothetical protein
MPADQLQLQRLELLPTGQCHGEVHVQRGATDRLFKDMHQQQIPCRGPHQQRLQAQLPRPCLHGPYNGLHAGRQRLLNPQSHRPTVS